MAEGWLRRRVVNPFIDLLKQGITPEKIALSVALGVTIGVFPVLGSTTILCGIAAWALKLNIPAMQLVNYLVYPLQLALLIPFLEWGNKLFGSGQVNLTLAQVFELIRGDTWRAMGILGIATLQAVFLWIIVSPVAVAGIYFALTPVLKRMR
jgi:Uncharacterized protein conserved in bacteria (DUF2062)